MTALIIIAVAGLWAGVQNTLAGGGSFVTLPALLFAGMTPLSANITSTVALFPGQLASGYAGRGMVRGVGEVSFRALVFTSLAGGAAGALLLLITPPTVFAKMIPWLVLFATAMFAWGSFGRKPSAQARHVGAPVLIGIQFLISIYGGYFGGGIGFLMMAALSIAGMTARNAGATKNALAAAMNASAVAMFAFSPEVKWLEALVLAVSSTVGYLLGVWVLRRVNETMLRIGVVVLGLALTIGLFWRQM
ncbi:sulfite exporter TauE/SafE family protein [Rhodopseudomonas palustris]|uniref:sulfite exporter TauE/SafE family protein n=1 Tax=Rhodopseudomonas TaxID=1073 RepID=UPI0021F36BC4|nr:sulfite exporter TauE/SafE family protein [Rhodopseudomonas palustris]UYO46202.1 sulfite exporter TauE/SafE family protein [Rhodopseudomonas palustris]UYO50789.1 sulfite exporter TauE/SafE family protein [Rhodopseudomonas palustris]UYO55667.1 sulfite exporter TauE/SafE family protein [Rhodopseudomonas palustris]